MIPLQQFLNVKQLFPQLAFNAESIASIVKNPIIGNINYPSPAETEQTFYQLEISRRALMYTKRSPAVYEQLLELEREYSLIVWKGAWYRRCPPEILSLIFVEATTHCNTANHLPLLNIMLLCKRFHDIALSTHALWARITIPVYYPLLPRPGDVGSRPLWPHGRLLKNWLERTGQVPLNLQIGNLQANPASLTDPRMMPLLLERNRWQSLKLVHLGTAEKFFDALRRVVTPASYVPPPRNPVLNIVPMNPLDLEQLALYSYEPLYYEPPQYPGPIELPNLKFLSLSGFPTGQDSKISKQTFNGLHAPRLHTLVLESAVIRGELFVALLSSAPNLKDLTLHDAGLSNKSDLPILDLAPSKLESLSFRKSLQADVREELPGTIRLFSQLLTGCKSLKNIKLSAPYYAMAIWKDLYFDTRKMEECPSVSSVEIGISSKPIKHDESADYFGMYDTFLGFFPNLVDLTIIPSPLTSPENPRYLNHIESSDAMIRILPRIILKLPKLRHLTLHFQALPGQTFIDVLGSFTNCYEDYRDMVVRVSAAHILMPAGDRDERRPWEMKNKETELKIFEQLLKRYCHNLKVKVGGKSEVQSLSVE